MTPTLTGSEGSDNVGVEWLRTTTPLVSRQGPRPKRSGRRIFDAPVRCTPIVNKVAIHAKHVALSRPCSR